MHLTVAVITPNCLTMIAKNQHRTSSIPNDIRIQLSPHKSNTNSENPLQQIKNLIDFPLTT